jgi:hypothetical protein
MTKLVLQERDLAILRLLGEHGFATGEAIAGRYWPDAGQRLHYRRLRRLIAAGFVKPLVGDGGRRLGYCLTAKGAASLRPVGDIAPSAWAARSIYRSSYDHDRLLLRLRSLFESSPLVSGYLTDVVQRRKVAAARGRPLSGRDRWKLPDASFRVALPDRSLKIALELELSSKSHARYDVMLRQLSTSPEVDSTFIVYRGRLIRESIEGILRALRAKDPQVRECPRYHGFYFAELQNLLDHGLEGTFEGEGKVFSLASLAVDG